MIDRTRRGEPVVEPVFRFRPRAGSSGCFEATGIVPTIADVLQDRGHPVDGLFAAGSDTAPFEVSV